ncbi:putative Rep protein [Circovirus-like genome DHCV-2]|uniref:Replication-associated protein n=1 Tax=Circovirus-like genome DHCV-2 TaxID=1788451 RepID=A0A190WHF6_9VIRU|nr:putative Rep protein [Circovirus-like genome DHCV-2]AMB42996.1 putative Rep protein [Circovirus-like genome DHCV-2]
MPAIPDQQRWWILTIPHADFTPYLFAGAKYVRGQLELGAGTGFLHWQIVVQFEKPQRLTAVKKLLGQSVHAEPTRSEAAVEYVWKEDTRVDGTQFELGNRALRRNDKKDWNQIRDDAKSGNMDDIPADVYIRCYNSLRRIGVDHLVPVAVEKRVFVFWGATGTGKSRRAWEEAGISAYPKDPRSKFWDGYRSHESVVIDEFRGGIDISHMLRWLDRHPVIVEVKGSSVVFSARTIWITSNLSPDTWYPGIDEETRLALRRRFTQVVHFNAELGQ